MSRTTGSLKPVALAALLAAIPLSACQQAVQGEAELPGGESTVPYAGIAQGEVVRFTGTEPFWGGEVSGGTLRYATPEDQAGTAIAVTRFVGRNGISYTGTYRGAPFTMAITPGNCSDGMSDRTYPFTVTLQVAGETRQGCAWTEARPFEGSVAP